MTPKARRIEELKALHFSHTSGKQNLQHRSPLNVSARLVFVTTENTMFRGNGTHVKKTNTYFNHNTT